MNYFDLFIFLNVIYGLYRGFSRGLVLEFTSLLGLSLGLYCSLHFSQITFGFLSKWIEMESIYLNIVSYAVTFIGIMTIVSLLGRLFTILLKFIALGFLNRMMGALFGGVKLLLIISFFLMFFDKFIKPFGLVNPILLKESLFYKPIVKHTLNIYPNIIKEFQNIQTESQ